MASRSRRLPISLAVLFFAAASVCAAAEPAIPKPAGYVTDAAGVLGEWAGKTDALCRDIERQTTAEVAVLTIKTTAPLETNQYAQKVFDQWKIGKKGRDNGVLVLLAVGDRKMWIATGYGVEGVLPDGKAGEIRDSLMLPLFRQNRYGEGIYVGVASIGNILSGGKIAAPKGARKRTNFPLPVQAILLLPGFAFIAVRAILAGPFGARRRGGGYYVGGGGFGGGGFGGGGFGGFGGGSSGGGGAGGGW